MIDTLRRLAVAVLATAAVLVVPVGAARATDLTTAAPISAAGWAPTWRDDFTGDVVDPTRWGYDVGPGPQFGDAAERETYTDSRANAYLDGAGHLTIDARADCAAGSCAYTSARLRTGTLFSQRYGRFTARIQVPAGAGVWPAFWAQGDTGQWPANGEIDVMDDGAPGENGTVAHGGPIGPRGTTGTCTIRNGDGSTTADWYGVGGESRLPSGASLTGGYHVFSTDWYPDHISTWVDGLLYSIAFRADVVAAGCTWPFDQPFWLLLNVAVGGGWPGPPVDPPASGVYARMKVDYVEVSAPRDTPATAATGPIRGRQATADCLDVWHSGTADGTAVDSYPCNGSTAQQWTTATDGTLRAFGRCLVVTAAGQAQLATCTGAAAQRWIAESDGGLRNASTGTCLTTGTGIPAPLTLAACTRSRYPTQAWSPPPTPALAARWRLADGAGDTAPDTGGAGLQTLTCTNGVTWADGGATLDGADASCETASAVVDTRGSYTISAWARLTAVPAGNRTVVSQDGASLSAFYLQYDGTGKRWAITVPATDDAAAPVFAGTGGGPVRAGTWQLLTGVIDRATGTATLYVDGKPAGTPAAVTGAWRADHSLAVGRGLWAGAHGDYFPGSISDVRVYPYALDAAAVSALYATGR
ncbi:glycoside hydrolase family protein [Actinoplanes sp. SE50]|uniref:LamG-like jellyroll fold domain-containing protein n=1 Tax=unclassified Actinoplanes TaxID=2626549 RepID=UPI00023EC45E|nr:MULTISPECIES: LamG-like jellyroll fold domain-containing protein [unclassified Actinoplanes]AEV84140.1 glycoside hydrolase family 16 [Actinoplanes sp. SE50/110]ATO82532.1 glycoside hydrolase family protein [Actinoplanes sp. SE50]SLL99939.1 hypothetical protein ACSP50_3171 [Actinoplanes sp. SE50/110]